MKPLALNNRTFLAWPVEETPKDLQLLIRRGVNPVLVEWNGQNAKWQIGVPRGTYSKPFLLSQVDEERAAGMVSRLELNEECGYLDYETLIDKSISYCHKSALESFHSWLRANGVLTTESKDWIFVEQLTSK